LLEERYRNNIKQSLYVHFFLIFYLAYFALMVCSAGQPAKRLKLN